MKGSLPLCVPVCKRKLLQGQQQQQGAIEKFRFCFQTLIIDDGTEVLWYIFDNRLQTTLHVFLASNKMLINHPRVQKTITSTQYDLLFPSDGGYATGMYFDISLILCLLKNILSLGLNRSYIKYGMLSHNQQIHPLKLIYAG